MTIIAPSPLPYVSNLLIEERKRRDKDNNSPQKTSNEALKQSADISNLPISVNESEKVVTEEEKALPLADNSPQTKHQVSLEYRKERFDDKQKSLSVAEDDKTADIILK